MNNLLNVFFYGIVVGALSLSLEAQAQVIEPVTISSKLCPLKPDSFFRKMNVVREYGDFDVPGVFVYRDYVIDIRSTSEKYEDRDDNPLFVIKNKDKVIGKYKNSDKYYASGIFENIYIAFSRKKSVMYFIPMFYFEDARWYELVKIDNKKSYQVLLKGYGLQDYSGIKEIEEETPSLMEFSLGQKNNSKYLMISSRYNKNCIEITGR